MGVAGAATAFKGLPRPARVIDAAAASSVVTGGAPASKPRPKPARSPRLTAALEAGNAKRHADVKATKGMSRADLDAVVAKAVKMAQLSVAKAMRSTKAVTPAPQPSLADTIAKHVANYCNGSTPAGAIKTTATSGSPFDVAVALGRVNPVKLVASNIEAAAQPQPHLDDVRDRAVRIARQRNDVPGPLDYLHAGRQLRSEAKR